MNRLNDKCQVDILLIYTIYYDLDRSALFVFEVSTLGVENWLFVFFHSYWLQATFCVYLRMLFNALFLLFIFAKLWAKISVYCYPRLMFTSGPCH